MAASDASVPHTLVLRVRRYLQEISEITDSCLSSSSSSSSAAAAANETQNLSEFEELFTADGYLTLNGLRRNLVKLEYDNKQLRESNAMLEKWRIEVEKIPSLESLIQRLEKNSRSLSERSQTLENRLKRETAESEDRFAALQSLYIQMEEAASRHLKIVDSQHREIEKLRNDVENWRDKANTYEYQIGKNAQEFEKIHDSELKRIELLNREKTVLKNEFNSFKDLNAENIEKNQKAFESEIKKIKDENSELKLEVEILKQEIKENVSIIEENKQFSKKREALENQLSMMQIEQLKLENLKGENEKLEASLVAMKQRLFEHTQNDTQKKPSDYDESQKLREKLKQWNEALSVIREFSGCEPTPEQLNTLLHVVEQQRQTYKEEVKVLRESKSEAMQRYSRAQDALTQKTLELEAEKSLRQAAEYQCYVMSGQLKSHTDIAALKLSSERHKWIHKQQQQQSVEEGLAQQQQHQQKEQKETQQENVPDVGSIEIEAVRLQSINSMTEIMARFSEEKEKHQNLIRNTQQKISILAEEKDEMSRKMETACLQFARLEDEFKEAKQELKKKAEIIEDQKRTLGEQKQTILRFEQSVNYQQVENLKRQVIESDKRKNLIRQWFVNELSTFRAAIKTLFGWSVRIDRNHADDRITISLIPAISDAPIDDETFISFAAENRPPSKPLSECLAEAVEEFVWTRFKYQDFEFTVGGRFTDHWEQRWSDQLSFRRSFPALLAIITLDEHNRVLKWSSMASSCMLQQQISQSAAAAVAIETAAAESTAAESTAAESTAAESTAAAPQDTNTTQHVHQHVRKQRVNQENSSLSNSNSRHNQ